MDNFKSLQDNDNNFKKVVSTLNYNDIITKKQKIWENYEPLNLLQYAISLGNLISVKLITTQLRKLGVTFETDNLGFFTLEAILKLLEFTSFETLKPFNNNDYDWDTEATDEWENEEIEETEENIQFHSILQVLDYFLKEGIMKIAGHSYLILLGATINLFDGKLIILRKMLPFYNLNLRTEYMFEGKLTSLMHLAIQNSNMPLFQFLIEAGYDINDYSYTPYNPVFEVYKALTYSKYKKDSKYQIYEQMFNFVFKGNPEAYKRAIAEFYLISKNNFDITDTFSINKLPYQSEIAEFRGFQNQTLLSISQSPEVADAVLDINNINPMTLIPLQKGLLGVAVQYVSLATMPPILERMNPEDIKSTMPWFLENKEIEKFYLSSLYLYKNDPNDTFLDPENLLKLGLSKFQIDELRGYIAQESQKSECCVCGDLTSEGLQCTHTAHYQCLAKLTTTTCPCCNVGYTLPEPHNTIKIRYIKESKKERDEKWRIEYAKLQAIYGEHIPADELYKLTVELGT